MSGSAMFVQPPGSVPIPMLADADGQCYYASGGISRFPSFLPPINANNTAYTTGQCIGGLNQVSGVARAVGNGSGIIYGAIIADGNNRSVGNIDLLLFSQQPFSSTFVDKSEAVVNFSDTFSLIGNIHVTDWTVYGATTGSSVGNYSGGGQFFQLGKTGSVVNTKLWAVLVARTSLTTSPGLACFLKILPD